ncbi:hypothetical protein DERP_013519 [Dermatophagoides pteronyssinus]|uniref:Peroxidase-like n=1 Tax=Dermatophagoides pteronyssinus TaxID=6956 RepID=A0ABQ8IXK8_DERPT|nr:hypothetical protein DERP_013519 [Dermatophagoides pteronyssinus]
MMKSFIFRSIFLFILLLSLSILSCNSQHIFQFTQKFPSIQRSRSTFVNFVNQHRTPKLLRFNNDERRSNTISSRIDSLLSPRKKCEIGTCQFYYNCARKTSSPSKFCEMNNGFSGVCCHDNVSHFGIGIPEVRRLTTTSNSIKPKETTKLLTQPTVNLANFESKEARQTIQDLVSLENELRRNDLEPKSGTQEFSHQNFFGGNQLSLKEMNDATQALEMFISFVKSQNLSIDDIQSSNLNIQDISSLAGLCEPNPVCQNIRYRNPDGTCNNLIYTNQGKAVSTFTRLLSPDYGDRINEPRRAMDGSELPNARQISMHISPESQIENDFYSTMLMQFGQFIDHDISRTAITRTHDDKRISCCDEKVRQNPKLLHPACFVIPVPLDDFFLRAESQTCINFVRSAPAVNPKCRFGPREQLNQISSYIDGDHIYGPSLQQESRLRQFQGGLMKVTMLNQRQFPPTTSNRNEGNCQIPRTSNMSCFLAGDIRANEVVDLVVLHTVFLREHNRIATILQNMHQNWNDETLFQETKRIIIAELQHIIYNEMLPLILGPKTIEHFGLKIRDGYSDSYDQAVDATILNEFSTAAYRLHSLVNGILNLNSPENEIIAQISLRDVFANPSLLYQPGVYDMRIAGLIGQGMKNFDNFFTRDVTNHLFQAPGKRFGLDLVALNIQRGRDHGIQSYVKYRELCGLSKVESFADLRNVLSNPTVADVLSHLYKRVEDVDLFIAGTSEQILPGAVVGPTFACIIGEQFRRTKEGDRFWYENGGMETSFTPGQLAEIKKISLAKILCDNSDVGIMQRFALLIPSVSNPKIRCDQLPSINLNEWI